MNANDDLKMPRRYDDPSTKIWALYLQQAEKSNNKLTENWKGDMDAILIFAGLFSASVTTLIVESYQSLKADNADTTVILLAQIYQQLSNDTTLNGIPSVSQALDPTGFTPSTSALICNILWFLSLSLSLTAALSATLVQQWTRNYNQATVGRDVPHQRARLSAYLYEGLNRFHMQGIVAAIPILLHASLLLFFAGLVEFLRPVNPGISYLVLGLLLLSAILYILITILPVYYFDCPYRSPLTTVWWRIVRSMNMIRWRNAASGRADSAGSSGGGSSLVPLGTTWNLEKVQELDATRISNDRDERDFRAIRWTLEYSPDDSTLEMFAKVLPDVIAGFDYSAKLLCRRLLDRNDPPPGSPEANMRLGYRLTKLLGTCSMSGQIDPVVARRRSVTTLNAIWSLTMMELPSPTKEGFWLPIRQVTREMLSFDEGTLGLIDAVRVGIPDAESSCVSTATVIARSLLDMLNDQTQVLESTLSNYERTKAFPKRYEKLIQNAKQNEFSMRDPDTMLELLDKETLAIEMKLSLSLGGESGEGSKRSRAGGGESKQIHRGEDSADRAFGDSFAGGGHERLMTSPALYNSFDSLLRHIHDTTAVVFTNYHDPSEEATTMHYIKEILLRVQGIHSLIQQAGFALTLDFIGRTINASASAFATPEGAHGIHRSLPHETFNTIRRLSIRLNLDLTTNFSEESQGRLIRYLDEALKLQKLYASSPIHSQYSSFPSAAHATTTPFIFPTPVGTSTASTSAPPAQLPKVINMLFPLLRGVTHPECIAIARNVVEGYLKSVSSNLNPNMNAVTAAGTSDAAKRALARLIMAQRALRIQDMNVNQTRDLDMDMDVSTRDTVSPSLQGIESEPESAEDDPDPDLDVDLTTVNFGQGDKGGLADHSRTAHATASGGASHVDMRQWLLTEHLYANTELMGSGTGSRGSSTLVMR